MKVIAGSLPGRITRRRPRHGADIQKTGHQTYCKDGTEMTRLEGWLLHYGANPLQVI